MPRLLRLLDKNWKDSRCERTNRRTYVAQHSPITLIAPVETWMFEEARMAVSQIFLLGGKKYFAEVDAAGAQHVSVTGGRVWRRQQFPSHVNAA